MWFLWIYIGFSLLTFILVLLQVLILTNKLFKKYKDKIDNNHEKDYLSLIFETLKILIISFIPIINIAMFYVVVFYGNKLEGMMVGKIEEQLKSDTN